MEQSDIYNALFEDPDFPADSHSLFSDLHSSTPVSKFSDDITWMRPQEVSQQPRLFSENLQENHVKQGILGDCWFLCACAALQCNDRLLKQVIPSGQATWGEKEYNGCFLFRFWQFGRWVEVVVDDRLPCIDAKLCFSRCQCQDVFWVALLEKAYAKLNGTYERLWAGQVCEALVDLCGGVAKRWKLKASEKEECETDASGSTLEKFNLSDIVDNCMMSCCVHSSHRGSLGEYHAFVVMEHVSVIKMCGDSLVLLRIRNPWGRRCWDGPWKEDGDGWEQLDPEIALPLRSRVEEGEFWVDEIEFGKEFDEVTVAYPFSIEGHMKSLWTGANLSFSQQVYSSWIKDRTAGGSRNTNSFSCNPKFWLKIQEVGEVLLCLHQWDLYRSPKNSWISLPVQRREALRHRCDHLTKHHAIGFHVWKVKKKRLNLPRTLQEAPCLSTLCHAYEREVSVHCVLSPGYYLVIPSIFLQGAEGRFLMRAFSTGQLSLSEVKLPDIQYPANAKNDAEWETISFDGQWLKGNSAGGSRNFSTHFANPILPFKVNSDTGKTTLNIVLQQHCQTGKCHAIGFHIYQVAHNTDLNKCLKDQEPIKSCTPHRYTEEISIMCVLPPGNYVIIPSTYEPDCVGFFTVSIATRIDRKPVRSQETLGRFLQEVSYIAEMRR
ncbi:calpain-10 [Erpetoichthys calabaricus]|uniref:calpain-10 n=1 Tax=Erpetoichthys calabaricus TaxID=27687 RepID=UPI00223477AF|nr:calpain-10 [Erpetoichthys calabaricus]XP_051778193.1 calpain-10 [Erpetoichthys calabaricus]XP_051778194.1 calpain-10 [Erpetoichthys calabaricus]XP_051778195.1 calpain-10 [Erpetoichthys calabaricus]